MALEDEDELSEARAFDELDGKEGGAARHPIQSPAFNGGSVLPPTASPPSRTLNNKAVEAFPATFPVEELARPAKKRADEAPN